ncbi:MAG TPA: hypothetical protein VKP67_06890 [Xanthobacteraceae bacterium]|nr:hypothetical protein [Xanthobacteraceae bacterium]
MPNINTPDSGHNAPDENSGWQWLPYTDATLLATLKHAIRIIDGRIKGFRPCDRAFRALPGGRSFTQVWTDPDVWISFDPKNNGRDFGVTNFVGGKEISVTKFALRMGHWTTAATLVHEMAHVNGAPGGDSHAAEGTLRSCLLSGLEDPNILGAIERVADAARLA